MIDFFVRFRAETLSTHYAALVGQPSCWRSLLVGKPQPLKMFPLLIRQLYVVGVQSMLIILISGLFIGMVLGLQGYTILVDFWR